MFFMGRGAVLANDDQLNVRVGKELLERVNRVATALGKKLKDFVAETLDERTKDHVADVEEILEIEKRIAERDKARKKRR